MCTWFHAPSAQGISVFVLWQLFPSPALLAQERDSLPPLTTDTGYIWTMDEFLAFKLSANSDVRSFTLPIAGKQATIAPNMELINKLSVNYRFLSFSVSYAPKFIPGNADDERKGVTQNGGFDLDLNFPKWIMGGHYTWTYGYFLANTKDFDPSWDEDISPYVQFTDLFYREWGGFLSYKANPRFSLRALTTQTERQRRSAGSFFPILSGRYYIMDDRTELSGMNSSQRSDNMELMLSPGYYHTFVMKRDFYVGLGTYSGIGILHTDLTTRTPEGEFSSRQDNPILRVELDAGVGYNGERFFAGGHLQYSRASYNQQNSVLVVVSDQFTYQFFVGYRMNAPKLLRNIMDGAVDAEKRLLQQQDRRSGKRQLP